MAIAARMVEVTVVEAMPAGGIGVVALLAAGQEVLAACCTAARCTAER